MYSIIQQLKNEGSLRLYHDYRSGAITDYSGNNLTTTINGTITLSRDGFRNISGGYLTIAHSTTLEITNSITIVYRQNEPTLNSSLTYIVWKQGTNPIYTMYNGNASISMSNGTTTSTLNFTSNNGWTTYSSSVSAASKPQFYKNGVYLGQGNNNITVGGGSSDLRINPQNKIGTDVALSYVLVISRVLTGTEHALLYYELENVKR